MSVWFVCKHGGSFSFPFSFLPSRLNQQVCRVHATVFSELGAVISNMVRFGCPEDEIRSFLDYMCSRSQLTDEQVGGVGWVPVLWGVCKSKTLLIFYLF